MVDISSTSPVAPPRNRPFTRSRINTPAPPVEEETNVTDIPTPTEDYATEMAGRPSSVPAPDTPVSSRVSTGSTTIDALGTVLSDVGRGMVGGARDAAQEVNKAAFSLAGWLNENVADLGQIDFSNGIEWKPGMPASAPELPEVDKSDSLTENLVRGVSQFLTAFLPLARAMKVGSAPSMLGQFGRGSAAAAIADATAFDPQEERLSNLVEEYPALSNPVSAYLAADPSDSEAEGRFKNAVEGLGLGAATEGLFLSLKAIRASNILRNEFMATAGDTTALTRVRQARQAQRDAVQRAEEAAKAIASNNPKLRQRVLKEIAEMSYRIGDRGQVPRLNLVTGSEKKPELDPNVLREDTKELLKIKVDTPDLPEEVEALYKPETVNKLVAVVSDLEQAGVKIINPKKPVIDSLGDLLFLEPDVVPHRALQDAFSKYQLSWEDVLAGTIASGSEAGRILNRLSQLRKGTKRSVAVEPDDLADTKSFFTSTLRRAENVRRGALVSAVATASRNFQSGVYRLPTDSLANIIDTALINLKTDGVGSALKGLVTPDTYKKNFATFNWVFNNPKVASDYINLILDRPQFAKEFSHLTDNLNEIRNNVRVEPTSALGKGVDKVLTEAELFVDALNIPNKFQEQIIRRGFTLAEMERLVKAHYKQDLLKLLDEGRLSDLLNNSSDLVPEKAPRFEEIISDSVLKGMQASYSSRPENNALATASDWWARTGGTLAYEFPRFLALTVEFLAENSAGIGLVARRKLFTPGASIKDLTAQDRRNISRNLVTLGSVYALYKYYDETDADVDYTSIELPGSDKSVDITAVWPLRPLSWTASAIKHIKNGTYDTWIGSDPVEIITTFALPSLRASGGGEVLFALRDAIFKDNDGLENSKVKDAVSKFAASYLGSFGALSRQSEQLEQLFGVRGGEQRDISFPPDPTKSLGQTVEERAAARIYKSAEQEAKFPQKVSPFYGNLEKPPPGSRLAGVTLRDSKEDNEVAKFLTKFGYSEYRAGSQDKYPKFRREENTFLYNNYPSIVSYLKKVEEGFRKKYPDEGDLRQVVAPIVFANVNVLKAMASAAAKIDTEEFQKLKGRLTGVRDKIETLSARVTNTIEDIKEEIKNVDAEGRYQIQLESYTRLPLAKRRQARVVFKNIREKEPDLSSAEDLTALMVINEAMKSFEP